MSLVASYVVAKYNFKTLYATVNLDCSRYISAVTIQSNKL